MEIELAEVINHLRHLHSLPRSKRQLQIAQHPQAATNPEAAEHFLISEEIALWGKEERRKQCKITVTGPDTTWCSDCDYGDYTVWPDIC